MNLDWIIVLGIFCIGQCAFLSIIYFIKDDKKSITSYLLITLLLIFAFDLTHDLFVYSRLMLQYPFLVGWASLFTYLKGPVIYFLIKSSTKSNFKFHWYDGLHLVVFFIKNIENIFNEISRDVVYKLNFLNEYYYALDNNLQIPANATVSLNDLWLIHPVLYLIVSIIYLFRKEKNYNEVKSKRLFWIRFFIIYYSVIYFINISFFVLSSYFHFVSKIYWAFSSLQFCMLIIIISYANLSPQFYNSLLPKKKAYKNSSLNTKECLKIMEVLDVYIMKNETYLIKRLSLSEVSKLVNIPVHHISQAINKCKSLNFQDYINEFRIEKAKQLIATDFSNEYTFSALSIEIGFNSISTFNRAFKKFTKQTPKQYLNSIRN
ncbi:helix-turn-helix domain-containing protein [Pontimicrobium aquaticum]|uniref:Helix-turn-helix transcriptional regulator n=1 Tax=Pontimicrobium aquaticum TaxID=2565367 RepID=A0A4U0F087_9FLAO|nr:AraC family transcriptional regulator [Pontimicrobium aquaticum]TJY37753.1 helix-turn-helix transcriptional regulator [Pontimicrobium aquaticum]